MTLITEFLTENMDTIAIVFMLIVCFLSLLILIKIERRRTNKEKRMREMDYNKKECKFCQGFLVSEFGDKLSICKLFYGENRIRDISRGECFEHCSYQEKETNKMKAPTEENKWRTGEEEMKLGKIYDYRNKEEAKKLIGKKVIASDCLCDIEEGTATFYYLVTLTKISKDNQYPFFTENEGEKDVLFQFIREIEDCEEKPTLMTNRQLAEWLAKGNGERKLIDETTVSSERIYFDEEENQPVREDMVIRSWGSDEWVEPTLEIYERDCKSYCRTTLA